MKVLVLCTTDSMIWNFLIPHIKYLLDKGHQVECACSRTGFYFDELVDIYGFTLHEIQFERSPFKIKNCKAFCQLVKLVKSGNYNLIHCHEPVGGAMGRLAGKISRKKVMYFAHGFHFFKGAPFKHWVLYYVFEYLLSFLTDSIVTICNEDYNRAKRFHSKSCYYIHGIGVDFKKYELHSITETREKYKNLFNIPPDVPILLSVGELSVRKNHKVLLCALPKVKCQNVHLVICGEGEELKNLSLLAQKLDIINRVHFAGFRRDIPEVLSIGDAFVFPSLWEGLGLAGIEAMYSGLPVIGSNRQGIKDYVIDGKTGFLFEPENSDQLAHCINKVLSCDRTLLVRNGHEVASQFSLGNVINELDKIYKSESIL